jgi:2-dehydro-3-deoxygalactonokinase
MADNAICQKYVLGDWGTSRLRLFLLENDAVAATCDGPGIGALATSPAATRLEALADLIAPWTTGRLPIPVLLSGMAGSRNGLVEVPYAALPLRSDAWCRKAATLRTPSMNITIAAGVRSGGGAISPDVMRGEETQIFGAMQLDSVLGRASHLVVLPGTHSKWVAVSDGSIERFRSAITGELYALLRDHSTLFRTDAVPTPAHTVNEPDGSAGFRAGVERSANLDGGLPATLFEARAAQLLDGRSQAWAAGFVSGLLIACEIGAMCETFHTPASITLIGDAKLTGLYQAVFAKRGVKTQALDGGESAIAGLQYLQGALPEL